MKKEKYIISIGEEGSKALELVDYKFNKGTQKFLMHAGLKPGMKVLDIGCGSGIMTCWIAEQVGNSGFVVGIDNNKNQLQAAKNRAEATLLKNTEFKLCSAYDIQALNEQFDWVYCRFVLHHLHDPDKVVTNIFQVLLPGGIYVAEEGIVSASFSYPFSKAWGDYRLHLPPPWTDIPHKQRDPDLGIKMFTKMHMAGFKMLMAKIVQPLLTTHEEKALLLVGRDELKKYYLSEGHTKDEWDELGMGLQKLIDTDGQIIGFYGSCQVAGIKP